MTVTSAIMELNILVSTRMINKVGIIILPGTNVTMYLDYSNLFLIGHGIFRDKRNRQQLELTLAYGIRKKSTCGEQRFLSAI